MYEWTDTTPSCNRTPALEPFYRIAVSTACATLEMLLDQGRPPPEFSGGRYRSPKNDTARAILDAIDQKFQPFGTDQPSGAPRQDLITFAVYAAHLVVRQHREATCPQCLTAKGSPELARTVAAGWEHFCGSLSYPPRHPRRDPPAPQPEG